MQCHNIKGFSRSEFPNLLTVPGSFLWIKCMHNYMKEMFVWKIDTEMIKCNIGAASTYWDFFLKKNTKF